MFLYSAVIIRSIQKFVHDVENVRPDIPCERLDKTMFSVYLSVCLSCMYYSDTSDTEDNHMIFCWHFLELNDSLFDSDRISCLLYIM